MADLLRVSIQGALPGGEEWSVNPVWGLADFGEPVTQTQVQTIATAVANVVPAGTLLVTLNTATTINGCRVEARKRDGELEALAEAVPAAPYVGTGPVSHPYQTSWVSSLRTAQVGASGRGRLYWPATGAGIQATNLRPTLNNTDNFASSVRSYLNGIQTAIRVTIPGAYLAVWSRKQLALFAVNKILAGDVLDVQRRRRDALFEAYSNVTFP